MSTCMQTESLVQHLASVLPTLNTRQALDLKVELCNVITSHIMDSSDVLRRIQDELVLEGVNLTDLSDGGVSHVIDGGGQVVPFNNRLSNLENQLAQLDIPVAQKTKNAARDPKDVLERLPDHHYRPKARQLKVDIAAKDPLNPTNTCGQLGKRPDWYKNYIDTGVSKDLLTVNNVDRVLGYFPDEYQGAFALRTLTRSALIALLKQNTAPAQEDIAKMLENGDLLYKSDLERQSKLVRRYRECRYTNPYDISEQTDGLGNALPEWFKRITQGSHPLPSYYLCSTNVNKFINIVNTQTNSTIGATLLSKLAYTDMKSVLRDIYQFEGKAGYNRLNNLMNLYMVQTKDAGDSQLHG